MLRPWRVPPRRCVGAHAPRLRPGPSPSRQDGLCDCGRFGCCHPACCNAYFCPLSECSLRAPSGLRARRVPDVCRCAVFPTVLLGQVLTRLKLTWYAEEGTAAQTANTFRILTIVAVVSLYLSMIHGPGFKLACIVFVVCLVAKTRRRLRQRYDIPEGRCGDCDDGCTSFCCTCCALAQMAVSVPFPRSPLRSLRSSLTTVPPPRGTRPITDSTRAGAAARRACRPTRPTPRRLSPRRSCD